ncbi:MAG: inositol monophosphatase family protein [Fimbriimonas sp.]
MSPRLAFALDAAVAAGRSTLAHFKSPLDVELKADSSPVTVADVGAEQLIRRAIAVSYPGEAIFGEEEGGETGPDRWVIDPIDGTKSFVSGVPLYATLLSYEQDGDPIIGVCYLPALDELFFAEKGQGAFCNGRPIRVSGRTTLEGGVVSCGGHRSMLRANRMDGFLSLADRAMATRTWADAYGHVLVASGRIEAMVDPVVAHYDISAVSLIVREAGGVFTDFLGGERLSLEAVSSNGTVHGEVLAAFQ